MSLDMSPTTEPTTSTTAPSAISETMQFSAPLKEFTAAAKRLAAISDRKSTMPMLGHILITCERGEVTLAATDLNVYGVQTAGAWTVTGRGSVAIPAKSLVDVLKGLPAGDVRVTAERSGIVIEAGKVRTQLTGLPSRDFPKLPTIGAEALPLATVLAAELDELFDATVHAICKDETRFHLNGVLLEQREADNLRAVSTDGHRLVRREMLLGMRVLADKPIIVPAAGIKAIRSLLVGKGVKASVGVVKKALHSADMFAVRVGGATVFVKTIDAQFPPYDQVIPKDLKSRVSIDRDPLIAALKRCQALTSDTRGVVLSFSEGKLTLTADHPERGTAVETIEACVNTAAHGAKVGINPKYLIEALNTMGDPEVTISVGAHNSSLGCTLDPILVQGASDYSIGTLATSPLLCVIIPMRI